MLKDLCARLLYGVQLQMFAKEFDGKVYEHHCELDTEILQIMRDNEDIVYLPYLRPMSSMAEEEEVEYDATFDTIHINGHYDSCMSYKSFDFLNKKMFDYRGLIEKGLALEAPERIYKTKTE